MTTGHIHGFVASDWFAAKAAARELLASRAKRRTGQLISYTQLVTRLPLTIEPDNWRLSYLLDEISREEHEQGRGFLTVLVVHAYGPSKPGAGFFKMARECGAEFDDETEFHIQELNRVLAYWKNAP